MNIGYLLLRLHAIICRRPNHGGEPRTKNQEPRTCERAVSPTSWGTIADGGDGSGRTFKFFYTVLLIVNACSQQSSMTGTTDASRVHVSAGLVTVVGLHSDALSCKILYDLDLPRPRITMDSWLPVHFVLCA